MYFVDTNRVAHRMYLTRGCIERVRAAERGRFIARLAILAREIIRDLKSELLPPHRAHIAENVIHWRCAKWTRSGEFFVRIGNGKAFLIILDHLWQSVPGRDHILAKTRQIHRECIALCFALDHPLCEHQTDTAALAKACHDTTRAPIIAQARHRSNQGITVWRKGERAVNNRLDASCFEHRKALVRERDTVFDLVVIIRQKLMAEVPRRAIDSPRSTRLFIKADTQTTPFLAQIALARRVHHMRVLATHLVDFRNIIGDNILMLHRVQWQINPSHFSHFARPKTACVDHMLCMDRAFISHNIPRAIGTLVGLDHLCMRLNRSATHARGFGVRMSRARRVEMPIKWVIKRAENAISIRHRRDFFDLFRANDFCLEPHVAMLCALREQHVKAFLIVRQRDAAHMVQTARHACKLF